MRREVHQGRTLEYLALLPEGSPREASLPLVIWLHGFGADMYDLTGLAENIHPSGYLHVLPNAPLGGFGGPEGTVRAWFERGGKERPEGVRLALTALDALVGEVLEKFHVAAGQALLVGFSQGGNLALRYGLGRPDLFTGLAGLSCSLRRADDLLAGLPASRDQSIFLAHGRNDVMVPVECSRGVVELLRREGYQPGYQEYEMGHEIGPALFTALSQWITRTVPPGKAG